MGETGLVEYKWFVCLFFQSTDYVRLVHEVGSVLVLGDMLINQTLHQLGFPKRL